MSQEDLRNTIAGALSAYTGAPPIIPENYFPTQTQSAGEWARWSIRIANWLDADIGAKQERGVGTLYFQHFNPEGLGTVAAFKFSDKIGALLNRKRPVSTSGGVCTFFRAVCGYAGISEGKVQHNITLEWRWDAAALNAA